MLTPEEKREMLQDAGNPSRAYAFKVGHASLKKSMDDYIKYIDDFQSVFKPFLVSKKITRSHANRL
jgi:hypothetical protein